MSNLVDFIPFLQIFRTPMRVRGEKLHQGLVETYGGFIKDIEHKMQMGVHVPDCLAKTMIDTKEEEQMGHLDMAILASAFMIGGVETVPRESFIVYTMYSAFVSCRLRRSCNGSRRSYLLIRRFNARHMKSWTKSLEETVYQLWRMRR